MKINNPFTYIALAGALFLSGYSPQPQRAEFTAMTYNIYSTGLSSVEAIADVIRASSADLVSLQEVERFTENNPGDVPAQLAELTGLKYSYFIHALDLKKGEYGNAILSRFPIKDSCTIKMGIKGKDYIRSFGYVKVEIEGRYIYFGSTHLDHKKNDSLRMTQIDQILNEIRTIEEPFLLAGDLNATPDSEPLKKLMNSFNFPSCELQYTVPSPNPEKTIDYILLCANQPWNTLMYYTDYTAENASDHYPVICSVILL